MKAKSEGRRQNEECRSGEKLGSGIRAQPLGCRGLRQLWRTRERRQIVESELTVRREVLRTVYGRRVVEREGVIKCLTVRYLMSPGGCRKAAVHAATFSHFRHIEPSSGGFEDRRGEETAPCLGCLRGRPPEGGVPLPAPALRQAGGSREEAAPCLAVRAREAGARAGLASAGGSADAPACGQAVGSRLARTNLDLSRGRWVPGNAERMNGKAEGLNDRNTFFICDTDERGSGLEEKLEENVRLCSLMFAYVRLMGKNV